MLAHMLCVDTKIVVFLETALSFSRVQVRSLAELSIPDVGSSSITTEGLPISAMATLQVHVENTKQQTCDGLWVQE